jgi:hypothetical protein
LVKAMATTNQLKSYIAQWFQLSKPILYRGGERTYLTQPVLEGGRYSAAFEGCWQQVYAHAGDCHLEGTNETIAELMTSNWEIVDCARCSMPVPIRQSGLPPQHCPCHNLANWPNQELPLPHLPVNSNDQIRRICQCLKAQAEEGFEGSLN